ncbi:MAG: DUF3592 domain-containing protein, partial [Planctomycetota bacterium]
YRPDILYRYTVDGVTRKTNRYSFFDVSTGDYSDQSAIIRQYPVGRPAVCYVDPDNPASAVLDRSMRFPLVAILLLIFFVGIPGVILFAILKGQRSQTRVASMTSGKSVTTPSSFTGYRGDERPGASDPYAASTTPGTEGPIVLKPQSSRVGMFIGVTCVAVFWNGIVGMFVWQLIESFRDGSGNWFLAVFLVPFVIAGLAFIGGVVYYGLALFNPRIQLTVNASTIRLGDPLDVAWDVIGDARKFARLSIQLEGREEATYRRGTDTVTEKETFHTLTLVDTDDPNAVRADAASLTVPLDTMHFFEAPDNKIIWELIVRGDIPMWPDVKTTYAVIVLPADNTQGTAP